MRLRPGLLVLGALLTAGGVALFALPGALDDLRSPALASGLVLLGVGAAARDFRVPASPGFPGWLLLASLLVSLVAASTEGVAFLRQVRSQAGTSLDERREAALAYRADLLGEELAEAGRALPSDASVLVLFNSGRNTFTAQLLAYYLRPRRLYFWREGGAFQVVDGRVLALPGAGWLQERGIRWVLLLGGRTGSRVKVLPLAEVPRP